MKWAILVMLALVGLAARAGEEASFYRYKDANGNRVYSDQRPEGTRAVEQLLRDREQSTPPVKLSKRPTEKGVELMVDNQCFCPVLVRVALESLSGIAPENQAQGQRLIAARSTQPLIGLEYTGAPAAASFGYRYVLLFGDPKAVHRPMRPYRAPFAVAQRFRISQAFPARRTHTDAASFYAIDISMPVGTQIFAAREGTVIEVAAKFFEGSADPQAAARANIVRIVHPDGTMAIYAHLQWDSIRVRPGQIVKRGEYIANSGNTGFTTGPHLHFAVQKNSGRALESLPVEFVDARGNGFAPADGNLLIAY
jgi:murein DD-endopeptidase MepM/ murein hydrolase activator NlpD